MASTPVLLPGKSHGQRSLVGCSPREDGGAWWAAVYGVAQSRAWLKWLSSSSSSMYLIVRAKIMRTKKVEENLYKIGKRLIGLPRWHQWWRTRLPMQETQETWVQYLGWEDPSRSTWQSTAVFLPGGSHGQRSMGGYSPWGREESDTAEAT